MSTIVITPNINTAVNAIAKLYEIYDGCTGGYGHIVFDDCNVEDSYVDWCIEEAKIGNYSLSEETRQASIEALEAFKVISVDEREFAISLYRKKRKLR